MAILEISTCRTLDRARKDFLFLMMRLSTMGTFDIESETLCIVNVFRMVPKAYQPISLLQTISKGLERVVAQRLLGYLEREGKLSLTQFGARPRRSTEQALTILVEKIYDAWRRAKVLSPITFDV
jgi:hypothetical protein